MKNILRISGVLLILMLNFSCKKEEVPLLTTSPVTNITGTTAISGGTITSEGSGTVISRGVCWSTGTTPTIGDSKTADGAGAGSFTSNITGLNGATVYYVRAYAINNVGTGYGMALSYSTLGQSPTSAGATATNINVTSATLNGSVNANYLSTVVTFEYGTTTGYGSTATPSQSPITGNTSSNVSADITGLTAGTIYHYRIKSVNSLGTGYSSDLTFTTLGLVPTVSTLTTTVISSTSAIVNGTVNANYLSSTVIFEYGQTTGYGSTITASQSPITGNTIKNVSANISGLVGGTTYHYRIKALNSLGTTYGSDMIFETDPLSLSDVDGNVYKVIRIGTQVWMSENLKTTKYADGTVIPLVTELVTWTLLSTPGYCWYNNDEATYKTDYGALYNGYTIKRGNLCPTGWHIPTESQWDVLINFLGGINIAGGKLKAAGFTSWQSPNTGATNETDFTALAGGYRYNLGAFHNIGLNGYWWTSTIPIQYPNNLVIKICYYNSSNVFDLKPDLKNGFSVRCLKDY